MKTIIATNARITGCILRSFASNFLTRCAIDPLNVANTPLAYEILMVGLTLYATINNDRITLLKKSTMSAKKIRPFLWFNNNLEEAMQFYSSVFKNAKTQVLSRWGEGGMGKKGSVMSASFELEGQEFMALNGGPMFTFTEAISFFIDCESQEEVDHYWEALSAGGEKSRCGWLKDKFGLSWQVIPSTLGELLNHKDPAKAKKAMEAMMKMDKIIIADLKKAVE